MSGSSDAPASGSDYVLEGLRREGVDRLFGLIGEGNAYLLDRVNDHPIRFDYARHEQVAVTMADGYARATGTVATCTLTHGPGVTNGATGIAAADRDGVPLVVLVGDVGRPGRETSLQYLDHQAFVDPVTPYATRVETIDDLPGALARAFDAARTDRGPAVVELPGDIQSAPAPDEPYEPIERPPQRIRPDPERLAEAADLLGEADAPAILAGGGAARSEAANALERLAESIGAPVATTFFAKGIIPESHPLAAGIAGTFMTPANDDLLWDVDVLLAVGTRLSGKATRYGKLYADADVVQIDVDPGAFATHLDPAVKVVGDAAASLRELAERIEPDPDRVESVRRVIRAAGSPSDVSFESEPDRIDPRELVWELSTRLPEGALVTVDSGNNTGFPAVYHRIEGDGRLLVNGNFGTMGFALPAAIGAQLGAPDRVVVAYTGDGAAFQVLQAIETAARLDAPVIVTILNDESYGIIRHRQHLEFDRETGASYESPDFASVARGLGADGAEVRSVGDLAIVEEFLEGAPSAPLVLDARTIPSVSRPGFPPY